MNLQKEGLTKADAVRMYQYFERLERKLDALVGGISAPPPDNVPATTPQRGGKHLEIPKQIVPNYHPDNELELMKQVRHMAKYLMKRENRKSPFPKPPTKDELDIFATRRLGGPTLANFRLDLANYSYQSPWNLAAAELFADAYIGQHERDITNRQVIKSLFLRHLHDLGEQYKDLQVLQLPPDDDQRIKLDARNARRLVTTRRASLALRRYNVIEAMRKLRKFSPLLAQLGRDGMSDDEFAPGPYSPPKYNIVQLTWRSKKLTALLRALDALHIYTRFSNGHKPSRGNWPRRREKSALVDHSRAAPKGLPRNCYDKTWLKHLTPIEKKQLNAGRKINLKLPPKLQRQISSGQDS
ncbi:hypothetical protein K474DRAFT_1714334 [Panus rudis PR-1116 ss-1]|nr:hypothetical protein K474DRAFT_1714334 [Panus rudis PR-1116 ss-1]